MSEHYPIDVTSLLLPPEVVSIPDADLAAAVLEFLGLSPGVALTTHTMLNLIALGSLQSPDNRSHPALNTHTISDGCFLITTISRTSLHWRD